MKSLRVLFLGLLIAWAPPAEAGNPARTRGRAAAKKPARARPRSSHLVTGRLQIVSKRAGTVASYSSTEKIRLSMLEEVAPGRFRADLRGGFRLQVERDGANGFRRVRQDRPVSLTAGPFELVEQPDGTLRGRVGISGTVATADVVVGWDGVSPDPIVSLTSPDPASREQVRYVAQRARGKRAVEEAPDTLLRQHSQHAAEVRGAQERRVREAVARERARRGPAVASRPAGPRWPRFARHVSQVKAWDPSRGWVTVKGPMVEVHGSYYTPSGGFIMSRIGHTPTIGASLMNNGAGSFLVGETAASLSWDGGGYRVR